MLQWLTLLALFGNSLALGLYDDIDDYHLWRRGGPSVATTGSSDKECMKDILVLWDNSNSIGTDGFKEKVVPFLKKFIKSPELQVGKHDTNIGFITFSSEAHTKPLLKIGSKTEPDELETWLDGLDYIKRLSGESTYMGKAFKLANDEFSKNNPLNHRAEFSDVILLFTDGNPQGYRGNRRKTQEQKDMALDYSALLRNRGVKIIGMAVETEGKLDKTFIADLSTDGKVISATLANLDNVLRELEAETCGEAAEACECKGSTDVTTYLGPDEQTTTVTWRSPEEDENRCKLVESPERKPGSEFSVGKYNLAYVFSNRKNQRTTCPVNINVERCSCTNTATIERIIEPGETTIEVSWNKPEPNCPTVEDPQNPGTTGMFSVGIYPRSYSYHYDSPERQNFVMRCQVEIVIKGHCGKSVYDPRKQECCCGEIRKKIPGYQCCGSRYYNPITQDCCIERTGIILEKEKCP